ncbi:signal peptide peptidase SppA [Methanosarcinales archaeon]|nr:signal peptide peptidase SppA [Candidatus Syntrophoarchaeum sp.]RLG34021.1 MAG: signal peptide peptidase SppA [Methanosarcinales archaeon]
MKKRYAILIIFIVLVLISAAITAVYFSITDDLSFTGERVEVIYVDGTLLTGDIPPGFGYAGSENICNELRAAERDDAVKAIVIRINSPGGTPAAAQEIVTEIKRIDKPIVVSMADVAASGAYYIAAPSDWIVANPDTVTGSIGVIWVFENREGEYREEGINYTVVKSGDMKDMGAPWRNLTDGELDYANEMVTDAFERFVEEVAAGRNMTIDEVKNLSDGRVYLGADAKELGLVDQLGNLYDAIEVAGKLGGIEGEPRVEYANKLDVMDILF